MSVDNPTTGHMPLQAKIAPLGPLFPVLLAFTAGFVDTCGFVAFFGLFTAHVTGNFIVLGGSLADHRTGVIGKLLALPIFVLSVGATRLFLLQGLSHRAQVRGVFVGQLLFLCLFLLAGQWAGAISNADAPIAVMAALLGVFAMGVQNAAFRTLFASMSPTTVMTGNVTQIVIDTVDVLMVHTAEAKQAALVRIRKFGPPVLAFALGAAGAAVGFSLVRLWCLLVPISIVAVFAVLPIPDER